MVRCRCGKGQMIEIDGHWICDSYHKIIKENIENLQKVIAGGDEEEEEDF